MKKIMNLQPNALAKAIMQAGAVSAACVASSVPAMAQSNEAEALEEVVVTGIRRSIGDAIGIKRDASNIVDAISAEDIGKLPDENVAETLQRINGVQIQRRNGEGAGVSVRGLSQNRLEVDGVTLVNPTGRNSGPSESTFPVLQFVPSDLLSGVQVAKSASADQIEGSLGGTVNLTLLKPLDVGDRLSISTQAAYDDRTKDVDPRFSLSWSKVLADDTFGVLLSYSKTERSVGEELFFTRTGYSGADSNGDGVDDSNFAPGDLRFQTLEEDRDRSGFLGSLQWRPGDNTEIYLNAFYASYDLDRDRSWFSSAGSGGDDLADYNNPVVSDRGTIIAGEFNSQIQGNGESLTNESETSSFVLGGEHIVNNWTFNAKVSSGSAEQADRQDFARVRHNGVQFYRDLSGSVPSLDVVDDFDVLNPASYDSSSGLIGFSNRIDYESDETAFQFDVDYDIENSFITSVETGFRWADQESSRIQFRAGDNNGGGVWIVSTEGGLASIDPGLYEVISLSDVYGGTSNQAAYIAADPDGLGGTTGLLNYVNANPRSGDTGRSNQGVFVYQPDGSHSTEEEIRSVYLKVNFATEVGNLPVSGNVGVRYIETDQRSLFNQITSPDGVTTVTPTTFNRDYDNVLPSLNLRADLNEDLSLRFAASQVLSRPSTGSLAGGVSLDEAAGTGSGGNPALDPAEADAYDLSLEWYINDTSSLTAAYFYKDVDGFLGSVSRIESVSGATNNNSASPDFGTDRLLVSRVEASESSTIKGFELAYQNVWDNGFGTQLNYTYVDSDGVGSLPLEGLSEVSYNVVGFYEADNYSARLAYNWRDDYLVSRSFNGSALFQEARGQLDLSLSYDITENISVSLEGINLNDERVYEYATLTERPFRIANTGRRFFVGIRASF